MFASQSPTSPVYRDDYRAPSINDASPLNDNLNLDDSSFFTSVDGIIGRMVAGEISQPTTTTRQDEVITIVPLPSIRADKGKCVLVVYGNGQTQRYEQLRFTSKGSLVGLLSGQIIELVPN